MLNLRKVAITGGLSSGKTTVCKFFQTLGAFVVSADEIVHNLLSTSSTISQKVLALLGEDVVKDKKLDREAIAKKVFTDRKLLTSLQQILHPAVLEEIDKQYNQVKDQKQFTLFIAEIPLLYESNSAHRFDKVVAVVANPDKAKKRFQSNTQFSENEFEKRMTHQMSPQEKSAQADYTIENSGSVAELETKVETLFHSLTR